MVLDSHLHDRHDYFFQYSLCRVVLMVCWLSYGGGVGAVLSVLALSSRFDGLTMRLARTCQRIFQYSLCRVVLMV